MFGDWNEGRSPESMVPREDRQLPQGGSATKQEPGSGHHACCLAAKYTIKKRQMPEDPQQIFLMTTQYFIDVGLEMNYQIGIIYCPWCGEKL
jgi:hypothetical protein